MLREAEIIKAPIPATLKKLSDGGGLQLWLMPSGARLWRFGYRFEGKQRAMRLGTYTPQGSQTVDVGLKAARTLRDHYRGELAKGRDPNPAPTVDIGSTFGALAAAFRDKQQAEGRAPATVLRNDQVLAHVMPHLRDRPIEEIKTADLARLLEMLSNLGKLETAARARMLLAAIFRYAIASGKTCVDPTTHLRGVVATHKTVPRPAIVDPANFGRLLGMIDGFDGQATTRAALKLLPLLACRPGELRLAEWREFDLDRKLWTIPAARAKMRREHKMHLPDDVIAILRDLKKAVGSDGYLFPALGRANRTMSENTVNAALRSMGVPGSDHCAHGFRSSFSTIANESGKWRPDVIERHLAHEDANSVRRTYNRAELWKERVELAEWWVDECRSMAVLWG